MSAEVVIVDTGSANLASVVAAFERLGARTRITEDASSVRAGRCVVVPGVGAFGPAMARLRAKRLDAAIGERFALGRPVLGICLGMQLAFEASEESPGVDGIGAVAGCVGRFASGVRTPQMGWNLVRATSGASIIRSGDMYFANSFRVERLPVGWEGAITDHGGAFVSAIERGPVVACQFHPELSGAEGRGLLGRWVACARECEPW